jgi:ProP effector
LTVRSGAKRVIVLTPPATDLRAPQSVRPVRTAGPKAPPTPLASKRHRQALATLAIMHVRWPKAFPSPGSRARLHPVAIGIHAQIAAAAPDLTARRIDLALRAWTGRLSYLEALAKGRPRVDIDGRPVAQVTEAERDDARKRLRLKRQGAPAA